MVMTTVIEVNNLLLTAHHGVMPQERTVGNIFDITVHVHYPFEQAMRSDDVDHTLNYAILVDLVKEVMSVPSLLLENVVYRLRKRILAEFPEVRGGMIRLAKLNPPIPSSQLRSVAVKIQW